MNATPRNKSQPLYDPDAVREAARLLIAAGQVVEVRALEATTASDRWAHVASGYFDDPEKMVSALAMLQSAKGVYFTPNPVDPALLARAANRLKKAGRGETTQDTNILTRTRLLIDTDAQRPSGISATDAEHQAAIQRAVAVRDSLRALGWPEPLLADSGNGGHLVYGVDLPADDDGLIQRCLKALAERFDDELVKIDTSVHNPSRIWKLYDTLACKGDSTAERPHRMARMLERPDDLHVVERGLLEALAAEGADDRSAPTPPQRNGTGFDLDVFLSRHPLDVDGPHDWLGQQGRGRRWTFTSSPMCEHHEGAAHIEQHASGAISAGCHHDSCKWDWDELRERFEPNRNGRGLSSVPSADGWEDFAPLPAENPPVAPFDVNLLPASLRPWVGDIAERMQCPVDFPAVAAMVVLAGIVGRRVGIRPKRYDDWLVVPNLWGAVIGRPGLMKTPAIVEPLKVLKRLEIEAKQAYIQAHQEYLIGGEVRKAKKKVAEQQIKAAVKGGEDATGIAAEMHADAEAPPVRRRYLVNDSTVEKVGEILNENPDGVTVYRDELIGLLKSLDKEGQEGARAFFLEAWNGSGRYTYDRIGRGTIDIEAAIVSIIGGIQPGPLAEYQQAAVRGGKGDDGLLQRFQLAVWPDCPNSWRNVDRWPDTAAKQTAFDTYLRLHDLELASVGALVDQDGDDIPFLRFADDAQALFDDWRAGLEERLRVEGEHPAVESHLAKYRSLIPSLALLIHLADAFGGGAVSRRALGMAIGWGEYLESHARRIYAAATSTEMASARALARKIIKGKVDDGFARRDVQRKGWSMLSTQEDAKAACEVLTDLNWLREVAEQTSGRPKTSYLIHPRILAHPPERELTEPTKAPSVGSVSVSAGGEDVFSVDAARLEHHLDWPGNGDATAADPPADGDPEEIVEWTI